jgi:hypothetical protein
VLNLHMYNKPGHRGASVRLGMQLREEILPELFFEIWGEKLDPDTVDIVFAAADSDDTNKADIGLLIVPQAHIRRAVHLGEMKQALRERVRQVLDLLYEQIDVVPRFEVDIAFNIGGGVSDSGSDWRSQIPLLVDPEELKMALTRAQQAIHGSPEALADRVDNIEAAMEQLLEVISGAAGFLI